MGPTYRDLLATELAERKRVNPSFSLRAFARGLKISPGQLSSLISGRKPLTQELATRILAKLTLSSEDRTTFISTAFPELHGKKTTANIEARILREDEFSLISEWYHFAILSLGNLKGCKADARWISKRLGISEFEAKDALRRLIRLGLVIVDKQGGFKQSGKRLTTTNDIPSEAIRRFHRKNLALAQSKLDTVRPENREFLSITTSANPEKLGKVKKMLREFKERVSEELEVGKPKSVYCLSMQLFPLSNEESLK